MSEYVGVCGMEVIMDSVVMLINIETSYINELFHIMSKINE